MWGGRFMSFSSPLCSPLHHAQPPPSFHSRLHNHCTAHKGLSSQVQSRLARIKERFQLKMFFPSLFFFPPPAPSLSFLVFPFLLTSLQLFSLTHICCTLFTYVSSILAHFLRHISCSPSERGRFKNGKTSHHYHHTGFVLCRD